MDLDVAVIGAGFSGLAALHLLRERGLRVHAFDAAGNVGGTWWWHGYPGSHLDTECHLYQYFFAEQLYRDWGWSERYPAGYEVQRWFRFAADRLDLRRDLSLSTRVLSAVHDDDGWRLTTAGGGIVRARELVTCTGRLPVEPSVDGSAFGGLVVRTAAWREDSVDLGGRRVGIVGTTPATVQLVPWIVDRVASLVVVDSGAVDVVRRDNPVYGWQERAAYQEWFAAGVSDVPRLTSGVSGGTPLTSSVSGGTPLTSGVSDVPRLTPHRGAMRARTDDPRLIPVGEPGQVVLDDGYLEAFDRDHVELVDRVRVGAAGLELADGTGRDLDVLVVPDSFDAGPPALVGIEAHPTLHTVVATLGRTPCLDLQE